MPEGPNPELLRPEDAPVEMAIGRVRVPGVYEIEQTGQGMTAKYMAEQSAESDWPTDGQRDTDDTGTERATGTLLINGEPVLDADGNRILIAEDQPNGETYDVEGGATIVTEDTSEFEAGTVVGPDGEPLSTQNAPDAPFVLPEDGWTVATGTDDTDDGTDDGDDTDTDDGDGDGDGDDDGGGDGEGDGSEEDSSAAEQTPEGATSIEAPPVEVTVKAYCTNETWQALDDLRDQRRPFDIAIGEFGIAELGITDLSRTILGETGVANDVTVKLKEFQEITVQTPAGGGGGATDTDSTDTNDQNQTGPVYGWVDQNQDQEDDESGRPIPEREELTLDPGETYTASVGTGELWGNKLIDASADGANVRVSASGENWVVKNLAVRGSQNGATPDGGHPTPTDDDPATPRVVTDGGGGGTFAIEASVPSGGQGVVENIYLGDGGAAGSDGGVRVAASHAGELKLNRINVARFPNHGIHASAGDGEVDITNCFAGNNAIAGIRVAGNGTFDTCVVVNDGTGPTHPESTRKRGVWVVGGTRDIVGSHIKLTTDEYAVVASDGGEVTFSDSQVQGSTDGPVGTDGVGAEPQVFFPAGCPTDAEDGVDRETVGGQARDHTNVVSHTTFAQAGLGGFATQVFDGGSTATTVATAADGNQSVRVDIPTNAHHGFTGVHDPVAAGGAQAQLTEMYATFWVRFADDFEPGPAGGKLPGFEWLENERGVSGDHRDDQFTATAMWTASGDESSNASGALDLGYYIYHNETSSDFGNIWMGARVERGEWHKVGQYIKLNSAGAADGELRMWVNESLAIDRDGIAFTTQPGRGINYGLIIYFGGSEPSPIDNTLWLDAFTLSGQ